MAEDDNAAVMIRAAMASSLELLCGTKLGKFHSQPSVIRPVFWPMTPKIDPEWRLCLVSGEAKTLLFRRTRPGRGRPATHVTVEITRHV